MNLLCSVEVNTISGVRWYGISNPAASATNLHVFSLDLCGFAAVAARALAKV